MDDKTTNPAEDNTGPTDGLDEARMLLDSEVETDEQGINYSQRAIALVLLWQAEQQRDYKRANAEWARRQRENVQPSPPFPPFMGF